VRPRAQVDEGCLELMKDALNKMMIGESYKHEWQLILISGNLGTRKITLTNHVLKKIDKETIGGLYLHGKSLICIYKFNPIFQGSVLSVPKFVVPQICHPSQPNRTWLVSNHILTNWDQSWIV
jgi:hypothetical protein